MLRRVAFRFGILDYPAVRKAHTQPMPLLGGVGLYIAVLSALLLYPDRLEIVQGSGILIGATWISFWGLWDDRSGLGVPLKFLVQVVAVLVLLISGIRVQLPLPGWLNLALTFFWVIGITNAFNLLDNVDGLCGGIGAVAAAIFLALAAIQGQYLVSAFAAALLGACLGFLLYNFNPARIFMGDVGSLFLGFLLAALGIKLRFPAQVPWVTWMIPVVVLGVPIFDTTLVCYSRLRRGKNPLTTPGQDHLSHRLLCLGWTLRRAVLFHYALGLALGGVAFYLSSAPVGVAYWGGAGLVVLAVGALVWLERRAPVGDMQVEGREGAVHAR